MVIKTLCERAITALPKGKNEQQRDMAVIALKTVVSEVPGGNLAVSAANTITNKMLEGVSKVGPGFASGVKGARRLLGLQVRGSQSQYSQYNTNKMLCRRSAKWDVWKRY